jgi:hypothetical protein
VNDVVRTEDRSAGAASRGTPAQSSASAGTASSQALVARGTSKGKVVYDFTFPATQGMIEASSLKERHMFTWAELFNASKQEFEGELEKFMRQPDFVDFNKKLSRNMVVTYSINKQLYHRMKLPGSRKPSNIRGIERRAFESISKYENLALPDTKDYQRLVNRQLGWAVEVLTEHDLAKLSQIELEEVLWKFDHAVQLTAGLDDQGLWEMSQSIRAKSQLVEGVPFDLLNKSLDAYIAMATLISIDVHKRRAKFQQVEKTLEESTDSASKVLDGYGISRKRLAASRKMANAYHDYMLFEIGGHSRHRPSEAQKMAEKAALAYKKHVDAEFYKFLSEVQLTEKEYEAIIKKFIDDFRNFALAMLRKSLIAYRTEIEFERHENQRNPGYLYQMYVRWSEATRKGQTETAKLTLTKDYKIFRYMADDLIEMMDAIPPHHTRERKKWIFAQRIRVVINKRLAGIERVIGPNGVLEDDPQKVLREPKVIEAALLQRNLKGTPYETIIRNDAQRRAAVKALRGMLISVVLLAISLFPLGRAVTMAGRLLIGGVKGGIMVLDALDVADQLDDRKTQKALIEAGLKDPADLTSGWWIVLSVVGAGFSAVDVLGALKGLKRSPSNVAAEIAEHAESDAKLAKLLALKKFDALDEKVKVALRARRNAAENLGKHFKRLRYLANRALFMNPMMDPRFSVTMLRMLASATNFGLKTADEFVLMVRRALGKRALSDDEVRRYREFFEETSEKLSKGSKVDDLLEEALDALFETTKKAKNHGDIEKFIGTKLKPKKPPPGYTVVNLPNGKVILRREAGKSDSMQRLSVDADGRILPGRKLRVRADYTSWLKKQKDHLIKNRETHPLKFLIGKRTIKGKDGVSKEVWDWNVTSITEKSGKKRIGRYGELQKKDVDAPGEAAVMHVGHQSPFSSGKKEAWMLQDADHNLVSGQVLESKGSYGFFDAVEIDKIIIHRDSALMYERLGLLELKGGVAQLPTIPAP